MPTPRRARNTVLGRSSSGGWPGAPDRCRDTPLCTGDTAFTWLDGHQLRIRVAISFDTDAIAHCRLTDPSAGPADHRMASYFDGRHHPLGAKLPRIGFLALDGETVVGYTAGHLSTRFGYQGELQYLFVAPSYRRHGVATTLLSRLAEWFVAHEALRVCVDVDPDSPSARPFYLRRHAVPFKTQWFGWEDVSVLLDDERCCDRTTSRP